MGLNIDSKFYDQTGSRRVLYANCDFDSSYPIGGESLTPASLGFRRFDRVIAQPRLGYGFEFDYTNNKLIVTEQAIPRHTYTVKDDDNAASTGVAVYVHIDEVIEQGSYLAHLEAVNAGNADSYFALFSGGPHVRVQDDDNASTGGLQVYFDEDSTTGQRLIADLDNVGDADVFVMASDGSRLRIDDTDTPGTPGVAVYFDDDAANAHQRLLFVSPTNANGTDVTAGEVKDATSLAHLTDVRLTIIGF